jgi:hypothetical protein
MCSWTTRAAQALILPVVAMLSFASTSYAQIDGWGNDGGPGVPPTTMTSQSTFGVTLGTNALRTTNPQGGFWGTSTPNLVSTDIVANPLGSQLSALQSAARVSFDLTLLSAQINGGSGNFSGFAQANEMAVQVFTAANTPSFGTSLGGSPFNQFIQRNFTSGNATDTLGQSATWSGVDGTRTLSWDLTTFTMTDPVDGQTKNLAQMMVAHPDIQDVKFSFVQQTGGGSPVGPGSFFYDNVRLLNGSGSSLSIIGNFEPVPEPGSLILTALAVPAIIGTIRRRRRTAMSTAT